MMTVEVRINGSLLHGVVIQNRGPVGVSDVDDGPGGGGERRYTWETYTQPRLSGEVQHRRDDGAIALAIVALEAMTPS